MLSINALLWFIHSPSKFKLYYMYIYLVYHAWCSIELSHFNPNANEPLLETMLKYNDCGPWFKTMEIYPEIAIKKKNLCTNRTFNIHSRNKLSVVRPNNGVYIKEISACSKPFFLNIHQLLEVVVNEQRNHENKLCMQELKS